MGLGAGTYSTYSYASNNPLWLVDPSGLFQLSPGLVTVGTAVGEGALEGGELGAEAGTVAEPGGGTVVVGAVGVAVGAIVGAGVGIYQLCHKDCSEITLQIYDAMNEIQQRTNDLLVDRCNLFQLAFSVTNPSLPSGCSGTWIGHIEQVQGWQNRLRTLIARAQRMGCPIPPDAWALATRQFPTMPRGYYPGR